MRIVWFACALLAASAAHADLCTGGRQQSPIDIVGARRSALPPLDFAYSPAPLKLANDGHTLRVRLAGAGGLRIGRENYRLQQVHFHTPGGDTVAGQAFPMAAHVLHKSASGQLLAVVVFFRIGAENPWFARLLPHVPAHADGDHDVAGEPIDASRLLPAARGYWRYTGSETSPPCREGVQWIVLKQPVELSAAQLAEYRRHFADNARPVQPLNGRPILSSP